MLLLWLQPFLYTSPNIAVQRALRFHVEKMKYADNNATKISLRVFCAQWAEYILFAALLVVVCVIFAFMAYFYTYIDPARIEAQFIELDPEEKERKGSLQMEMSRKDSSRSSSRRESHVQEKQTRI